MSSFIKLIILPLVLITFLCISAVELFYHFGEQYLLTVHDESVQPAPGKGSENTVVKDFKKPIDYSVITRRNLFASRAGAVTPVLEKKEPTVELSSMDVVLMGTVSGMGDDQRAIIYDKKDKKQELFQVGDYIEQAIIKQIMRGKVILSMNGKDEMLDISEARNVPVPKVAQARPVVQTRKVVGRPVGEQNQQAVQPAVVSPTGEAQGAGATPVKRPKQLRSYRGGVIVRDPMSNRQ